MGGTNAHRLKRQSNKTLDETQARLLKASTAKKKSRESASEQRKAAEVTANQQWWAARTPERREARSLTRRDQRAGAMSAQVATHALFAKLSPRDEAMLDQAKLEIEKCLDAVIVASRTLAKQRKVATVQIQFVKPGISEVIKETDNSLWRVTLGDWSQECGLTQGPQIRFINVHSVSTDHAHQLETHAQRYMINETSYDPDGKLGLFFSAAAVSPKGMSVVSIGNICSGVPHVLVVTLTVWFKNLNFIGTPQPSAARTDNVFGPGAYAVSLVVCCC